LVASRRPNLLAAEIREAKTVFGARYFWSSLLVVIVIHGAGLLFPRAILSWNASPTCLYVLEGLAFAVSLAALGTCSRLVSRHLERSGGGWLTEVCDTVFLSLVFVVVVSGLFVALIYRWGSSWGAMTLTPYIISVLRGRPAVEFVTQMPFLVQLHVLSTFAAMAVLPLTRLSVFLVLVIDVSVGLLASPVSAAGRGIESFIRKRNLSARFWPEED
jgi:nitrate reductase gamma subunit